MFAREIMTGPAVTVRTTTPVAEAAALLTSRGFTALPVVDDDDRLVGIVSEIDLMRGRIAADPRRRHWGADAGYAPSTVGGVMSTGVESLTAGADLNDIVRIMADERIRCLPVVDGHTIVGIITRRDVLRALVDHADSARPPD